MNLIWVMPAEEAVEATSAETTTAAVIAGGLMSATVPITPASLVIAADSGYDTARAMGIDVDVLVGDMDSISDAGLAHAESSGVAVERYPVDKDATDLEIAIDMAIRLGATRVTVHAGEGGTFGHLLGNALGLVQERWSDVDIVWQVSGATLYRAFPSYPLTLGNVLGSTVSMLPVGEARAVTATGLRWPLDNATLPRGTTRGLSNIATEPAITITVGSGAIIVVVEKDTP